MVTPNDSRSALFGSGYAGLGIGLASRGPIEHFFHSRKSEGQVSILKGYGASDQLRVIAVIRLPQDLQKRCNQGLRVEQQVGVLNSAEVYPMGAKLGCRR